jgi:hypothetical protein
MAHTSYHYIVAQDNQQLREIPWPQIVIEESERVRRHRQTWHAGKPNPYLGYLRSRVETSVRDKNAPGAKAPRPSAARVKHRSLVNKRQRHFWRDSLFALVDLCQRGLATCRWHLSFLRSKRQIQKRLTHYAGRNIRDESWIC